MKGTIIKCLKDMVIKDHDLETWQSILADSGMGPATIIMIAADIDDGQAINFFKSTCKILNIDFSTLSDKFGDYWSNGYADKMYQHYYSRHKNAKSFLLDLNALHKIITDTIANATPPKFEYEIINDKKLIMKYSSKRNLMDLFIGLVKGLGKHYKENIKITKLGNDRLEIQFT